MSAQAVSRHAIRGHGSLVAVVVAVVIAVMALVGPASTSAAAASQAGAGSQVAAVLPADNILDDGMAWLKDKGGEVAGWLKDKAGGIASTTGDALKLISPGAALAAEAAGAINNAAEGWIQEGLEDAARWVASTLGRAVAWMLAITIALVFSVSSPNLDADFVYVWSGRVFAFAIPITILFAFYQIAVTSIRMRGFAGLRRAGAGALFGTVASMLTLPMVAVLSRGVDEVKSAFTSYLEVDTQALSQKIVDLWSSETFSALAEASPTGAAAASIQGISFMLLAFCFFAFFTFLFAFGLLVIMVVRNIMLHGVVVLAPLAWSGLAAEPTRAWPRTILGWIAAILVAPLGVVIILGLSISGLSTLSAPESLDELVGQILLSGGMFLIAFFVPIACFSFFSFMGEAAVGSMHRQTQAGVEEGATTVGETIKTVAAAAAAAGAAAATGGASAGASGAAAGEGAAVGEGAAAGEAAGAGSQGASAQAASQSAGKSSTAGSSDGIAGGGSAGPGSDGQAGGASQAGSGGPAPGGDSALPEHGAPPPTSSRGGTGGGSPEPSDDYYRDYHQNHSGQDQSYDPGPEPDPYGPEAFIDDEPAPQWQGE